MSNQAKRTAYRLVARLIREELDTGTAPSTDETRAIDAELRRIEQAMAAAGAVPPLTVVPDKAASK